MSLEILHSDCKRAVNQLSNLSNAELDDIINNDDQITSILSTLDQSYLKEIENEKESLIATNNSMAEFNLSREPELVEGREKLQELSAEGEQLSKTVQEKTEQLRTLTGNMSLETALALIRTAASEMEEESDQIAKKYLDNTSELDEFLDQFLIKRQLMHLRLVKAEKLSKILSRDPALSNVPNYVNAPPVAINSGYFPGVPQGNMYGNSVPYPTGPLNMPMPGSMNYFANHY